MLQLLDHLASSKRNGEGPAWQNGVNLVGFSMGGMIALEMGLAQPARFRTLTLMSSHAGGCYYNIPPLHGMVVLTHVPKTRIAFLWM